jgi:hypothetical protein
VVRCFSTIVRRRIAAFEVCASSRRDHLPADLDSSDGTNRARGHSQIAVHDDLDAVRAWLARVANRKTTFENYRKEAERLLYRFLAPTGLPEEFHRLTKLATICDRHVRQDRL